MTPVAIGMMIFTIIVVLGGFAVAIIRLQTISKKQSAEEEEI